MGCFSLFATRRDTTLPGGSAATMADERPPSNPLQRVTAPIARAGVKGARGLARLLGLDRAAERGVERALDSDTAAKATERLLKTDTANQVWDKVLESDEAQKLVKRVADAPEIREAIASQGIGVLEDLRRGVRSAARRFDTVIENGARRVLRKPQRERRPIFAGAFSRAPGAGDRRGRRLRHTSADLRRDRLPDLPLRTRGSDGRSLRVGSRRNHLGADRLAVPPDSLVRRGANAWGCRSSRSGCCPRTEARSGRARRFAG